MAHDEKKMSIYIVAVRITLTLKKRLRSHSKIEFKMLAIRRVVK
jgi:hypothetical protein